jgi:hypothetical protein
MDLQVEQDYLFISKDKWKWKDNPNHDPLIYSSP